MALWKSSLAKENFRLAELVDDLFRCEPFRGAGQYRKIVVIESKWL